MSKYKKLEIQIKKRLSGDFLGTFQSAFRGLGSEFDSLREYIPGDSIKSIDWKTTAKLGDVHVKNYEEERDVKILFMIDNSQSLEFGSEKKTKKETLEEIFFLLAQSGLSTGHSIGVQINNVFIDFKKGEENIIKTLKFLSIQKDLMTLPEGKKISQLCLKNTLIFYITDNLTPNINTLKYLNLLNEVIFVNIFDYFENNLSPKKFEINFGAQSRNIFFGENGNTKKYTNVRQNKIKDLEKTLKKLQIEYLPINNRDDAFLEFYKFFSHYKA